jgi:hypothetical protein
MVSKSTHPIAAWVHGIVMRLEVSMLTHDDGTPMSDLYLIDCLLHMMVDHQKGGWEELEQRYNATANAMHRLRLAFESGEMQRIGLGLADYFRSTPTKSA